jgi:four helix bundle protein
MTKEKLTSYKDLLVWQKAIDISVELYKITASFPGYEIYGLTSQLRRSANSISLNIAEGYAKYTSKSYVNFLNIAQGSLNELDSGLILAVKLGFIEVETVNHLESMINEEGRMLASLIKKINEKNN